MLHSSAGDELQKWLQHSGLLAKRPLIGHIAHLDVQPHLVLHSIRFLLGGGDSSCSGMDGGVVVASFQRASNRGTRERVLRRRRSSWIRWMVAVLGMYGDCSEVISLRPELMLRARPVMIAKDVLACVVAVRTTENWARTINLTSDEAFCSILYLFPPLLLRERIKGSRPEYCGDVQAIWMVTFLGPCLETFHRVTRQPTVNSQFPEGTINTLIASPDGTQ